jgi:hypothetical protein
MRRISPHGGGAEASLDDVNCWRRSCAGSAQGRVASAKMRFEISTPRPPID